MRSAITAGLLLAAAFALPAQGGESEVRAAQSTIEGQLRAFQSGDGAAAYSFAAPNIKRIFPTADVFMNMVEQGYQPVFKPQSFSFGSAEELSGTTIAQRVMITGPDGKDYEALYQLELQPDGSFRITGVSLRAAQTIGA
ncbi:MAG: DUF4864 domain-containing protein [Mesorhizobium amorphae]|nr:MAG: DUF4864 domain-containing protein [Mesorhizobium amorphae]